MLRTLTKTLRKLPLPFHTSQKMPQKIPQPHAKIPRITHRQHYYFSTNNHDNRIKKVLENIVVDVKGEKVSLIGSGIVISCDYREGSASGEGQGKGKIVVVVRVEKDFPKVRNVLVRGFRGEGYDEVEVLLEQKQDKKMFQRKGNLLGIKKVIAVSSCKGGVGKSTIALNIAFGLQSQGFKVGLFDSDVYGPSLPTLINKQGQTLQASPQNANHILPKDAHGVKCMSFGFVANQPAAMRGPMASSIVSQLLLNTQWGSLDYLIVDTPPGTGDINLSLCEELQFDGAVIATTPQRLAFVDVMKGIKMFQDLRVRILAVVQNMSYYACSKCETTDQIFGKGYTKIVTDQLGIENSFRIPLMSQISKCSDHGKPAVLTLPQYHPIPKTYLQICTSIKKQLQLPKNKAGVFYHTGQRLVIVQQGKKHKKMNPVVLRSKCMCSECVDERTGEILVDLGKLDPEVYPVRIEERGNYAVGVVWSDGHKNSIYSFKRLFSEQIPGK